MNRVKNERPLPDSARPPRGLLDRIAEKFARGASSAFGVVAVGDHPPLPQPPRFSPCADSLRYGSAHYGIMIPDLPAPHHFLACASVLGMPGVRIADVDAAVGADGPRHTAVLVHGTAEAREPAFTAYSMKRDMELAANGSRISFGEDLEFSGVYPDFCLRSQRPDFRVDLRLSATGEYSWFAHGPLYQHISLMTRYEGQIESNGQTQSVSGLCTWEHFRSISLHLHHNRLLPRRAKLPGDFFTYQVINLDRDTQLLLTYVTALDRPLITAVYERVAGQGSRRLDGEVRFQVRTTQAEVAVAPDGSEMKLPQTFRWTVTGGGREMEIEAHVDTPMLYGLCTGYVGGYRWEGQFKGRPVSGRGYIEYIDQRD